MITFSSIIHMRLLSTSIGQVKLDKKANRTNYLTVKTNLNINKDAKTSCGQIVASAVRCKLQHP